MIKVSIIWDFDGPIGNVNATLPYNFSIKGILREFDFVKLILDKADVYGYKFVFAITGFTAEEGYYPYNYPEIVREIFTRGHEIASHSWKHEWFPSLTGTQISRSLKRSKSILEKVVGIEGAVKGFVLPHSRPMTWKRKLAFSSGDRAVFGSPGADIQTILYLLQEAGYRWTRLQYKTLWERIARVPRYKKKPFFHEGILCVPQHSLGFASRSVQMIENASKNNNDVVIMAHPAGLGLPHDENLIHFENFLQYLHEGVSGGRFQIATIQDGYLNGM